MATQPEFAVLSPRNPSVHPDDWPEFQLTNVRVRLPGDPDSDRTTCLLLASEHHPLTVTGDLQPLPKSLSHLYLKPSAKRTIAIELPIVRSFAYGQYGDGRIGVWALGNAGWFAIAPARAYRSVYKNMVEAVRVLYFIADAYREPRMSGKGKNASVLPDYSIEELFELFVKDEESEATNTSQAAENIYEHRDFLMASMMVGKEGIAWAKKPIYVHLRKRFAEEHKMIAKRLARPSKKATTSGRARQALIDTTSSTSSSKRKTATQPKKPHSDVISISSESDAGGPEQDAPHGGAEPADINKDAPGKRAPGRREREIATASEPIKAAPVEAPPMATPIREDSEEDEEVLYARKGKSVLRLKPTTASKGASKGGRPKEPEENDSDEAEAGPRSSPTKRKAEHDDDETFQSYRAKRRNSRQDQLDEGTDIPTSPSNATSPDATIGASIDPTYEQHPTSAMNHAPDPLQEDTWRCALDGCMHKVYAASRPDSQRLIREHYALHAYDDDQRVKMVKKLKAPSLPVERLMEKVRCQARKEGYTGSFAGSRVAGTRFPFTGVGVHGVVQRY